ncbi:MAG: NrdH-redoxin [Spirochaetes bacterium GWD1_27_9]|nr:MAG: NrdH-redoxin [Spirochaetes bacterium GWB1_27_13]OHD20307.1 MAG: NrdH-redoxin [Spirochaetes bacterium GWC1_27_15]OHD42644.1 MAG: NrdH-redoxin [Spirochaetes bacterium GWD1_27_9]
MLNLYCATWCPDCKATVAYLNDKKISYNYIDIEKQPEDIVQKVVEVNGGDDWSVPTFENNGKWIGGQNFSKNKIPEYLKEIGI